MSKRSIVFCVGVFVALLPFLGFPQSWDTLLLVVAGVVLAIVVWVPSGRALRRKGTEREAGADDKRDAAFAEHRPDEQLREVVPSLPLETPRTVRIRASRAVQSAAPRPKAAAIRKPRPTKQPASSIRVISE